MKAVVFQEPYKVTVEEMPDPQIEAPNDAIVRITTTNICGSDLHMYEGRTPAEPGFIFGHENQGIVEEVGAGVTKVKVGDRVSMPFNIGCGFCYNCERGQTAFCLTTNPNGAGAAYGYAGMGPYQGGQAEYLRVPFADFNCLELPEGTEHENDFSMLTDIFPTGYHGTEMAEVKPGETVAVFGAGPVGIMAAYSAMIRGASVVYVVDKVPERLKLAEQIGAVPIDYSQGDPADQIWEMRGGDGVQKSVEAVGYQAHDNEGQEHHAMALEGCIKATNPAGKIGCVGVFIIGDPGPENEQAQQGVYPFSLGAFFMKGLSIGMGQANVKKYNRYLRDLIVAGRAVPSQIVSHELSLDEAPDAYDKFDKRVDGYTKVVLKP